MAGVHVLEVMQGKGIKLAATFLIKSFSVYYRLLVAVVLMAVLQPMMLYGQNGKTVKLVPKTTKKTPRTVQKTTPPARPGAPVIRIVIDAGHGGHDPGTERSKSSLKHEKDLTLLIALKVGEYIEKYMSNIKIIYTRKADVYVSLDKRVMIANNQNADFFFSIHCNANKNKAIYGTQMHIHSHAFQRSKRLAYQIDRELQTSAHRKSRGVFNAKDRDFNLFVLQNTQMPGVLIETGFLTNAKEEKFLNSENGQDIIAFAIFKGFISYLRSAGLQVVEKAPIDEPQFILASSTDSPPPRSAKADPQFFYKIQIMASDKQVPITHTSFKKLKIKVEEWESENRDDIFRYRYSVGRLQTLREAVQLLKEVQKLGFKDAFIVPQLE